MENLLENFEAIYRAKKALEVNLRTVIEGVLLDFEKEFGTTPSSIDVSLMSINEYGRQRYYRVKEVEIKFDCMNEI